MKLEEIIEVRDKVAKLLPEYLVTCEWMKSKEQFVVVMRTKDEKWTQVAGFGNEPPSENHLKNVAEKFKFDLKRGYSLAN